MTAPASGQRLPLVPELRWRRVFDGDERELSAMRRWLSSLLPACPGRDDVLTVANELASNALQHTASGQGAWFMVEITAGRSVVRVSICDCGGPAQPRVVEDSDGEHGRGLLVVRELSVRTGFVGDQRGRLVWAEVPWGDAAMTPASASPQAGYEAAISEGEAALAQRFVGVPAWFGHATLAWWAVAGAHGLVSAPTMQELAGLLYRLLGTSPPVETLDAGQARNRGARAEPASWPRQRASGRDPAWSRPGTASTSPDSGAGRRSAGTRCRVPMPVPGRFVAGAA